MAKKMYGKAQNSQALKGDHLQTLNHEKKIFGIWETWKFLRCLTGILAPVSLIGFLIFGVYLWAAASAAGPIGIERFITFEVAGEPAYLFKATVNCAIIGLILSIAFAVSCIILGNVCKKKYKKSES